MKLEEGGKVAEYDGEVTAHDRPRRIEVLLRGGNLPAGSRMRVDYRLGGANGTTRLDYCCNLEAAKVGLLVRLMTGLLEVFGRMQLNSLMAALRREVEKAGAGGERPARAG